MATVIWRVTTRTKSRLLDLLHQLDTVHDESNEAYTLKDEIRSLPGFPTNYDTSRDEIHTQLIRSVHSYAGLWH